MEFQDEQQPSSVVEFALLCFVVCVDNYVWPDNSLGCVNLSLGMPSTLFFETGSFTGPEVTH